MKVTTVKYKEKDNGVEIIVVNNEALSPEAEMVHDLVNIIHVFSCIIYRLRKYKKKVKEDKEIAKNI